MEKNALLLSTTHDFLRKFLTEEVALLRERGYAVHYAANFWEPPYLSDEGAIRALGVVPHHVDIARSPYRLGENRRALSQLLELIQGHRVRALLCHTPVGGLLGRLAGRLSPRRPVVVYTAHGFHFYRGAPLAAQLAYYPAEWALARFTDILVTINAEDYRAARQLPLAPGGKVFRLPGVGLDRGAFSPPSPQEREAGRRALGVRPQDTLLLSVGELNGNKNHQVVLRALSRLGRGPGAFRACGISSAERALPGPSCGGRLWPGAWRGPSLWRATGGTSPGCWPAPTPPCSPPGGRGWAWRGWSLWPWGCRSSPPTTGAPGSICARG